MKIIDLTHDLTAGMYVFPGDPGLEIEDAQRYERGYFVTRFAMGTHTGTHIDTPVHKLAGQPSITETPIEAFAAFQATVVDCRDHGKIVDASFLRSREEEFAGCDGIIIRSGWTSRFGDASFFDDFPGFDEDVAPYLKEKGIHLLGTEAPSVHPERHESVHASILKEGIIILEAVALPEQMPDRFELYAMPLKLKDRDGSPVRAFALQRDGEDEKDTMV